MNNNITRQEKIGTRPQLFNKMEGKSTNIEYRLLNPSINNNFVNLFNFVTPIINR